MAIPAQVSAGVIKTFSEQRNEKCLDIIEKFKSESNKKGMQGLYKLIRNIEDDVKIGQSYITELRNDVLKYFCFSEPQIENSVIEKMVSCLGFKELKSLQNSFEKKLSGLISAKSQLLPDNNENDQSKYSEFKI